MHRLKNKKYTGEVCRQVNFKPALINVVTSAKEVVVADINLPVSRITPKCINV